MSHAQHRGLRLRPLHRGRRRHFLRTDFRKRALSTIVTITVLLVSMAYCGSHPDPNGMHEPAGITSRAPWL